MTKEEIIVQLAFLNSTVGAMRSMLIESGIIEKERIDDLVRQRLEISKLGIAQMPDEDKAVSVPKIIELIENQIRLI